MDNWVGLVWLVVLLLINAFFVAAEFAVVAARRSQIEPAALAGKRSAKTALWAIEHAALMLATCQLGVTVVSLLILNVAEPSIHHMVEQALGFTGWSESFTSAIGFIVALTLVTFLHVTFGEMVPKNASFSIPDRALLVLAAPLVFLGNILMPIIVAFNAIANGVVRLCGLTPRAEAVSTFTLEQVARIVSHSTAEGTIDDASGAINAAFEFTEKKAKDCQVVLASVVSLPERVTAEQVEQAVTTHGFSRYVVADQSGTPVGYLHLKDILDDDGLTGTDTGPVEPKRIRRLETVSTETDLEDALALLQRSGSHLARVVNTEGVVTGVLFLEDIIEELVGEVKDATRRFN
jgi:CBS domain containing-hemolysin-like protein